MFQGSIQDQIAYQRSYEMWRQDALSYKPQYTRNLRTVDALTTSLIATTATGTVTAPWFKPSSANSVIPGRVTPESIFPQDGKIPSSSFMGLFGLALLLNVQYSTITNLNTILPGIASGLVELILSGERILYWFGARFMGAWGSGYLVSNDNAGTSLVARTGYEQVPIAPLPAVKNMAPAVQITGGFTYTMASIPVDIDLTLLLHIFAGDVEKA